MPWLQLIVFSGIFILLAAFMAIIAFHVQRFRYTNDASLYIFGSLVVLFLLTGLLTYTQFNFTADKETRNIPSNSNLL